MTVSGKSPLLSTDNFPAPVVQTVISCLRGGSYWINDFLRALPRVTLIPLAAFGDPVNARATGALRSGAISPPRFTGDDTTAAGGAPRHRRPDHDLHLNTMYCLIIDRPDE